MKNKLLSYWNGLTGNQRRLLVWGGGVAIFALTFMLGSMAMNRGKSSQPMRSAKQAPLSIEPKLLEKSQYLESQKEIAKRDDKVAELQQKLDEITREKKVDTPAAPVLQPGASLPISGDARIAASAPGQAQKAGSGRSVLTKQPMPPPPIPQTNSIPLPPPPTSSQMMAAGQPVSPPETEIGDIAVVSSPGAVKQAKADPEDKKKTQQVQFICRLPLWRRPC